VREVQSAKIKNRQVARHIRIFKREKIVLAFLASWRLNSRMEKPDQFRELFRMQKSLNERIGVKTDGMSEEEKTKWILNYCRAMSQEMAELTDSVPWKWWAKYQKFDEQNARVEVVDLFHFLISMAQVLGMSADDVFAAYVKKNEVNFKRQETGYTIKDEHDSKHI
jgi:dimeric dUTPase (all-alpha-NTP-PPase superfamily)